MENKAISKMNKKELYEKCQMQQQEIQKLSLYQDDREDIIKHNKNSFNELLRENEKLKRELQEYRDEYNKIQKMIDYGEVDEYERSLLDAVSRGEIILDSDDD